MSATGAATGATVVGFVPLTVRFPYKQLFNKVEWTQLGNLQRILNKDVSTYRRPNEVMAALTTIRRFITPPAVKDAQNKDVLVGSIYSCRISPTSTRTVRVNVSETTLGNEVKGTTIATATTPSQEMVFPARQCMFVSTPQAGGQITFLPTATLKTQTPNMAVLLFNLRKMAETMSPDTYQRHIDENRNRKAQQQELIANVAEGPRVQALIAAETNRLTQGVTAIDKAIAQLESDQNKLKETSASFESSIAALQEIFDAAVAKEAELEGRYQELHGDGGMFGGRRRVKRKRTRKMRRSSRKATRKN